MFRFNCTDRDKMHAHFTCTWQSKTNVIINLTRIIYTMCVYLVTRIYDCVHWCHSLITEVPILSIIHHTFIGYLIIIFIHYLIVKNVIGIVFIASNIHISFTVFTFPNNIIILWIASIIMNKLSVLEGIMRAPHISARRVHV